MAAPNAVKSASFLLTLPTAIVDRLHLDAVFPLSLAFSRHAAAMAIPLAFYFKPVIVFVAMSWLFFRAYRVLNKPLAELAGLLGFDIPSTPTVDLACIRADGAIIHWSLPDKQKRKGTLKFEIHLNGNVINDNIQIHESAATITGLQPGCSYIARVSLVNNIEFSSRSLPIRFRTKPAASGDFFVVSADTQDPEQDPAPEPLPRARPYRGLKDITPPPVDAVLTSREANGGVLRSKRSFTAAGRKSSSAALLIDIPRPVAEDVDSSVGADTLQHLTERLNAVRREMDEAEKQAKEEEEEEYRQKEDLSKERDELKSEVTEKEKASRNLKREVNTLERQNTAAQNERTKHERMLQQKKQERQKLKDDMVRWSQEADVMKFALDDIQQQKEEYLEKTEEEKQVLRNRQAEESAAIKLLDDEVKEKSTEIKKLERTMRNSSPAGSLESEPNLVQQLQQDAEEKRLWEIQYGQMQQQYALTAQKLEQAKRLYNEQAAYLESLRARRRQEEASQYASPPSTQERLPRRGDSQRSHRAQSGHSSSESPRVAGFPMSTNAFNPGLTSAASIFSAASFLNISNGMTIPGPTQEVPLLDDERDRLTGGAPMSPGAGAELLPADLFGDGDRLSSDLVQPLPGLGSLPGLPGLPGISGPAPIIPPETSGQGPASPVSGSSRSPSVFASPQASQQNLYIGSPENVMDSDRRSIRSTRSNRATSGSGTGSRFSGMFGIKQRTKTVSSVDEGPALGKTQSHSMPRQDQGIPGIDSNTRKRNSSISSASFNNGFMTDGPFDSHPGPPSRRSRAFGFFSGNKEKTDGWPSAFLGRRPTSPRPGSTHSNELPRPSFDSSRWAVDTWPSNDAAMGARSSPLAFGNGWNVPQSSRLYGSRHPSRRASQQYGSSGPPEDILEDEDSDTMDSYGARQLGAIGTMPPSGSKKAGKETASDPSRLNPNAKDFKSFFSGIKLTGSKSKESASSSHAGTPTPDRADFPDDSSPPHSRKSRDTRSLATTESSVPDSVPQSPRPSADLARTASYSTSDAAAAPSPLLPGSAAGKESFIAKLSRKSSSSKFSLPTFKRDKSRLDPAASAAPTSVPAPAEDDEDFEAGAGGALRELHSRGSASASASASASGSGSVRNWGQVLKLGKRRGNESPSVSGMSMTTSGTEEEEEGEEGG